METKQVTKSNQSIFARFSHTFSSISDQPFSLDVDLTLPAEGVTAIFGPSGSGKTTLLRCIAGLEKASSGQLTVNDEPWQNGDFFLPTYKRPLGYVFQEASLFSHLSAEDNLNYAAKRASVPPTEERYKQIIEIMGINHILKRYPHQLSGGEKQRVAIARALLIQPDILLMDEPLASLDSNRKQEILPYLENLKNTLSIPILYVSHSMDEVAHLADYCVVMEHGQVVTHGGLTEVFSRLDLPQSLGQDSGVIIQGTVSERDTEWHLSRIVFHGGNIWVRDGGDDIGQTVRIRILARDVSLTELPCDLSSILNRIYVTVTEIIDDQDEAMALVRLKAGSEFIIARLTRRSVAHLELRPGSNIWAQIKSAAIVR